MLKTKKQKTILIAASVIVVLVTVGIFLFIQNSTEVDDNIPPIIKEMIRLNEDVKKTTIDVYNTSGKLESISMVQSRVNDIKKTIELIGEMRELVKKDQEAIARLIKFAEEHEVYFHRKNLSWIFGIRDFYTDYHVTQYYKSQSNYLRAFENLLVYTHNNFQNIMELKSVQHMKTYDVYYMRYRTAADKHNRFNRKRITFYKKFIEDHPEVSPFLPGAHHGEPFKFWDRFSF